MKKFLHELVIASNQAWSGIRKQKIFSLIIIVTIGISSAAMICAGTIVWTLLFKPLPYKSQDSLYAGELTILNGKDVAISGVFSPGSLRGLYDHVDLFDGVIVARQAKEIVNNGDFYSNARVTYSTSDFFSVLSVPMILGRGLNKEDISEKENPAVVISYSFWSTQFGKSRDVIGTKIEISGKGYEITGVISDSFKEPQHQIGMDTDIWIPWTDGLWSLYSKPWSENYSSGFYAIVRLKSDVSRAHAEQAINSDFNRIFTTENAGDESFAGLSLEFKLIPLAKKMLGDLKGILLVFLFGAIVLLILTIGNVANLLLSRQAQRLKPLAINAAFGAKEKDIRLLISSEIGILILLSLLLSLIVTALTFRFIKSNFSDILPRSNELIIDWFVIAFAFSTIAITMLIFVRICAKSIDYKQLRNYLFNSGKGTGLQISSFKRRLLIVSQIIIAILGVYANVIIFSLSLSIINKSDGFEIDGRAFFLTIESATNSGSPRMEDAWEYHEIFKKIEALSSVESVSLSESLIGDNLNIEQFNKAGESLTYNAYVKYVDPNFVDFYRIKIIHGQNLPEINLAGASNDVLISQSLAKNLGVNDEVLQSNIVFDGKSFRVVGIVEDIYLPTFDSSLLIYKPVSKNISSFLIKDKSINVSSKGEIEKLLGTEYPQYFISSYIKEASNFHKILFPYSLTATLTFALAFLVFFLASVGVYGVFSHNIGLRKLELGIRRACGAKGADLIKLIVHENGVSFAFALILSCVIVIPTLLILISNMVLTLSWNLLCLYLIVVFLILVLVLFSCYLPLRPIIKNSVNFIFKD